MIKRGTFWILIARLFLEKLRKCRETDVPVIVVFEDRTDIEMLQHYCECSQFPHMFSVIRTIITARPFFCCEACAKWAYVLKGVSEFVRVKG